MKSLTLTLSILCASIALVSAGPEPIASSGKEMKEVMQPAPSCHDWSGFYVGAFGGYKHSDVDADLSLGGDWISNGLDIAHSIEDHGSGDFLSADGAEAGGLIGYNWQFHNCWVVGLEADGGYLWLRDSDETGHFIPTGGSTVRHIASSFKTHYLATFAPRVGYSMGHWLPYVTGGLALGDLDYFQELHDFGLFYQQGGEKTETHAGWMVGGGLQYALNKHWSVRAQYQYIDLGSVSFHAVGTEPFTGFNGDHEASLTEHNASVAVIFGF